MMPMQSASMPWYAAPSRAVPIFEYNQFEALLMNRSDGFSAALLVAKTPSSVGARQS